MLDYRQNKTAMSSSVLVAENIGFGISVLSCPDASPYASGCNHQTNRNMRTISQGYKAESWTAPAPPKSSGITSSDKIQHRHANIAAQKKGSLASRFEHFCKLQSRWCLCLWCW